MSNEVDWKHEWVVFNGVRYSVTHYGINHCHSYEDVDGQWYEYSASMLHFEGELDLPYDLTLEQARGIAWNAATSCGYAAPTVDFDEMSIIVYGDHKAYKAWYGPHGGIIDVKNVTLEMKIEMLESEIGRMQGRLDNARECGDATVFSGMSLASFEAWIADKQGELDELKEELNVQNSNR